ncbi:MAG: glycosyltransferase family 9 protein [Panacagrimonas sp.]
MSLQSNALPPAARVRRIVALMIGEIGDLIVTYPTLAALKARYPQARLTLIARPVVRELAEAQAAVDEVLPFPAGASRFDKAVFLALLALRRWDLWVDLHTPTWNTVCTNEEVFRRNALLMRFAACRFRAGFAVPELGGRLTHAVPVPDVQTLKTENIVDTTLRVTAAAGQAQWRKAQALPPEVTHRMRARLCLDMDQRPMVALFFGAKQPAKFWPEAHVVRFLQLALERFPGHRILMIGGPHEKLPTERVLAALAPASLARIDNLVSRCSLIETAAVLALCEAVVSTDSGPMHLADAVGVPLVSLFSAFNYLVWVPVQSPNVVLHHLTACSPCFKSVCDRNNECMNGIRPEAAVQALEKLLPDATAAA